MTTTITPKEIFSKNQVLTLEKAKQLVGKRIACTSSEYHMNSLHVSEFVPTSFATQWEDAANREYPNQEGKYFQYDNFQQYWESYMREEQKTECKNNIILFDENGKGQYVCHSLSREYPEPTFTGSDADREVYFVEL
jgi:hypothetical protein